MGGREVGGLANQLAAHMGFSPEEIDRVGRFWRAPRMAQGEGRKAVAMFEAIERGEIKALWVLCTNPAASLPRADAARVALRKLDFLAVSDVNAHVDGLLDAATVVLPAAAWGEKSGTVTNSERRISRQRPFLAPPGEARPDWWQVCEVAKRLGHGDAFAFRGPADIFREHAALSGFENSASRLFDIGGLADLSDEAYDNLEPVQWPLPRGASAGTARLFADGGFAYPGSRARFVAPAPPRLQAKLSTHYPVILNTGRVRDQWHTMTRSGLSPRLAQHRNSPFVEVHPDDAARFGLSHDGFAAITSPHGQVELRVVVTDSQRPGSVFVPIHWTDATGGRSRVGALVHGIVDPISGQPDSKSVPVAIRPWSIAAQGFIVARRRLPIPAWLNHARIAIAGGEVVTFASARAPQALHDLLSNWLDLWASPLNQRNPAADLYRSASLVDHRLEVLLSTGPSQDDAGLDWAIELLAKDRIDQATRRHILAGRAPQAGESAGRQVCACFGVRQNAIEEEARQGAITVEAIGKTLKAGTNCGSCRPEIRKIVEACLAEA
jgi:assimilatory nitrate reductase catalytic subunit